MEDSAKIKANAIDLVKFMRKPKTNYLLFANEESLNVLIKSMTRHSQRFFLLDDFEYNKKEFLSFITINTEMNIREHRIDKLIDAIFKKEKVHSDDIQDSICNYAIMFTICDVDEEIDEEARFDKFCEFMIIETLLPKQFYQKKLRLDDNELIIRYTNKASHLEFDRRKKPNALFLSIGVGDFIMSYKTLIPFIKEQEKLYIYLNLYYITADDNIETLLNSFGICDQIIYLEYAYFYFIYGYALHSGSFEQCYLIEVHDFNYGGKFISKFNREYLHYNEFVSRVINYRTTDNELERVWQKIWSRISADSKHTIDDIVRTDKIKIGLQLCSRNDIDAVESRSFQATEVRKLCNMGTDKYFYVNLTPFTDGLYDGCNFTDASYLKLFEMFYLISQLDIVIGIDSVCGHIAAIYGIPSISLWTRDMPASCTTANISWRVSSLNYSLVPLRDKIKADLVFLILEKIINKEIILKENIGIEDTLKGKDILYI